MAILPADGDVACGGLGHWSTVDAQVRASLSANYQRLRTYIRTRVRTAEDADDLLQDYCVKVLCRSEQIRQREAVASWMAKVLRTTLVDYYRRQAGERRGWDLIEARLAAPEEPQYQVWRCHLGSALSAMKGESKDLIGRIDFLGQTRAEVAEAYRISVNALTVRLFRARTILREKLTVFCRGECDRNGTNLQFH